MRPDAIRERCLEASARESGSEASRACVPEATRKCGSEASRVAFRRHQGRAALRYHGSGLPPRDMRRSELVLVCAGVPASGTLYSSQRCSSFDRLAQHFAAHGAPERLDGTAVRQVLSVLLAAASGTAPHSAVAGAAAAGGGGVARSWTRLSRSSKALPPTPPSPLPIPPPTLIRPPAPLRRCHCRLRPPPPPPPGPGGRAALRPR